MLTFGEEVKRLAEEKGLTQKALAEACGVNQTFIGKLIRGEQIAPRADMLFRLSAALGVDCSHFRPFLAPDTEPAAEPEEPAAPPAKPKRGNK